MSEVLARGLIAGAVGVAAMTLAEKLEQAFTKRPNSYVPAHTLERLLGLPHRPDHERLLLGTVNLTPDSAQLPQVLPSSQSISAYEDSPGRIAPGIESALTGHAILTGGKAVTAELEVIVDPSVSGEKLLG
jgi:hypothetical protein